MYFKQIIGFQLIRQIKLSKVKQMEDKMKTLITGLRRRATPEFRILYLRNILPLFLLLWPNTLTKKTLKGKWICFFLVLQGIVYHWPQVQAWTRSRSHDNHNQKRQIYGCCLLAYVLSSTAPHLYSSEALTMK